MRRMSVSSEVSVQSSGGGARAIAIERRMWAGGGVGVGFTTIRYPTVKAFGSKTLDAGSLPFSVRFR